jgi:phosphopantothenoylcysteine decarboxylase/phosphopantothenate--cysteine ligase
MEKHQETILGTKSEKLKGKKIVLAVTGSIAAIETPKIVRELMRHGADVTAVMSKDAQNIIHPWALECVIGKKTITEIGGSCEHVQYCGDWEGKADLLLICPATANTISKIACGIDDTPVTTFATTALGSGIKCSQMRIMIAPAMHSSMIRNPFVMQNLDKLEKEGVIVVDPKDEEGKSKLDYMAVVEKVLELLV